jgi:hypothetical protein
VEERRDGQGEVRGGGRVSRPRDRRRDPDHCGGRRNCLSLLRPGSQRGTRQMELCAEYEQLRKRLGSLVGGRQEAIIGLDGALGSGKTTLGKQLATDFRASLISLDSFLKESDGSYLDRLDVTGVRVYVAKELQRNSFLIIEGILLLEALELIPTVLVYVRRVDRFGTPCELDLFDDEISEGNMIALVNEEEAAFNRSSKLADLDRDIIRYHKRVRPHEAAHIIFERCDYGERVNLPNL